MQKALFLLLLLLAACQGLAQVPASTITIQRSKIRVEDLLREITRQSGVQFSYSPRAIDVNREIAFRVRRATLEEALRELTSKVPVEYSIIEGLVVLNRREDKIGLEQKEPAFYTVSGFIVDGVSGENLIGATVAVEGALRGTTANAFGFYSLRLPGGKHTLEYSFLGFTTERVALELDQNEERNVSLRTTPVLLPDVLVELPIGDLLEKKQPGKPELSPSLLDNMPEFGGESGLIRGLQAFPGVKVHSDGSAFFFVRGGERDQNMILIDDAPVYNPAHLFGFYSLVIPDFARDIKLYKSDIPVSLGDRLSAIIDVRTKDGNLNKWEVGGAFNPFLTRFSLEGPLVREKSAIFTSLRQSNFHWIYRNSAPNLNLGFGDFSFKWNSRINNNNRLFFTLVTGRDVLENRGDISNDRAGVEWGNFAMTLRWNHIWAPNLFSNTVLYTGNYQYKLSSTVDTWNSGIGSLSLRSDFTCYNSPRLTTKFGVEVHGYFFNPGKILIGELSALFPTIRQDRSQLHAGYYNADLRLSEKWRLTAGARLSLWSNTGPAEYYTFDDQHALLDTVSTGEGIYNRYLNLSPRTSLQYQPGRHTLLKGSYGIYHQYLQLISNSTSPFTSFEVWLPSSPNIRPQRAQQAALGFVHYLPAKGLEWSAEAFYKKMDNQIDYEPHAQTLLNPLIEGELRFGQTRAYGLELLLKKDLGRLNGWIAYTYSRTFRQTREVNGGRTYPAFQDRPHDFSLMLNYSLSRRLLFSAYWTSYTGSPFSSPTGYYTFRDYQVPIFGEKHNDRLPGYRRLDLALKFILNKNPDNRYQHNLTFSIYNALAHRNVVDINFNKIPQGGGRPIVRANVLGEEQLVTTQADLVRFLPSLTYKFKWSN